MPHTITARSIGDVVSRLVVHANRYLPRDVLEQIRSARADEQSETAGMILDILAENAFIAANTGLPVCQDTGIDIVFLELEHGTGIDVDVEQEINRGISEGTAGGWLRSSVCDPITRQNSGNNTPAVVHIEHGSSRSRIILLPKGCGSENMSAVFMLPPSAGEQGVIDAVAGQVRKAGPNPCPPGIIGIGIGGTMEKAALLSKKALLRPVGKRHRRDDIAELERKIENAINALGVGPQGLGGDTTCLSVAAEVYPCHIASLPVAVNIQCHAARRASAVFREGQWEIERDDMDFAVAPVSFDNAKSISLPLSEDVVAGLSSGDRVLLNGPVFTGRDQTHRMIVDMLRRNESLPVDLSGALIYYTGPSPAPPGFCSGSAGPTTSYRMDAYTPEILALGVRAVMGKGRRGEATREALRKNGAVYLATIGGAGAYLAKRIVSCETVAFSELGPEALFRMELSDFPAIVINDADGNDYYEKVCK
jgi:fumarate hydratase subunit alpha